MTTEEPQPKRAKTGAAAAAGSALAALKAADCITFHQLSRGPDGAPTIEDGAHFRPEMTHQLFGDDEEVRGYEELDIDIFLSPQFQALVDVKASGRAPGATDLAAPFKAAFGDAGFFEDKAAFDAALAAEAPLPLDALGEVVYEAPAAPGAAAAAAAGGGRVVVTRCQLAAAPPAARALHARLQPLLLFFVDGASAIDAGDEAWELLLAVRVRGGGFAAGPPAVDAVLGFATLYSFYVFPDRARLRLSQVLVLPPHQGRGVGGALLAAAYARADAAGAVDLALEDPTDALRRLRDREDVRRAGRVGWLRAAAAARLAAHAAAAGGGDAKGKGPAPPEGEAKAAAAAAAAALLLTPDEAARAAAELRCSRPQARRTWEVLLHAAALEAGADAAGAGVAAAALAVRAGIETSAAAARRGAEGKAVVDTESGFVMARGAARRGGGPRPGIPTAPVEEMSAEARAAAVEDAVEARLAEIAAVLGLGGGSGSEDGSEDDEDGSEGGDE